MSLSLFIMPLKKLPISTKHVMMDQFVIGQYDAGFWNYIVEDMNLETQESRGCPSVINDQHLKSLVGKILVSVKCLRKWVSAFQSFRIISRKLAKWRNSRNGFYINSAKFLKVCLMLFLQNSNDPQWLATKKVYSLTILNDRFNGLIRTKHRNTFQNRNYLNRWLWWLSGGLQLELSMKGNWNLTKALLQKSTARNWMKCILSEAKCNWVGPILFHDNA